MCSQRTKSIYAWDGAPALVLEFIEPCVLFVSHVRACARLDLLKMSILVDAFDHSSYRLHFNQYDELRACCIFNWPLLWCAQYWRHQLNYLNSSGDTTTTTTSTSSSSSKITVNVQNSDVKVTQSNTVHSKQETFNLLICSKYRPSSIVMPGHLHFA